MCQVDENIEKRTCVQTHAHAFTYQYMHFFVYFLNGRRALFSAY